MTKKALCLTTPESPRAARNQGKTVAAHGKPACPYKVLVLGKLPKRQECLLDLLSRYALEISHIEVVVDIEHLCSREFFDMVIVTQSVEPDEITPLRCLMSASKIVYLCGSLSNEHEIALRSLGLIFLGSYDHFTDQCPTIMQKAFKKGLAVNAVPSSTQGVRT